jgi:hypothetical protein
MLEDILNLRVAISSFAFELMVMDVMEFDVVKMFLVCRNLVEYNLVNEYPYIVLDLLLAVGEAANLSYMDLEILLFLFLELQILMHMFDRGVPQMVSYISNIVMEFLFSYMQF